MILAILLLIVPAEIANAQQQPSINLGDPIQVAPVCVLGNVAKPAIISLEGQRSLLQALRAAGGPLLNMKSNGARVYRQHPGSNTGEVIVVERLSWIERGKVQDLTLLPYDVVEVISVKGKKKIGAKGLNPCMSWRPSFGIL